MIVYILRRLKCLLFRQKLFTWLQSFELKSYMSRNVGFCWPIEIYSNILGQSFCVTEVAKSGGEVLWNLKAYNGRVVTEWLAHCLQDAASRPFQDERLPFTSLAMKLSCMLPKQVFVLSGVHGQSDTHTHTHTHTHTDSREHIQISHDASCQICRVFTQACMICWKR